MSRKGIHGTWMQQIRVKITDFKFMVLFDLRRYVCYFNEIICRINLSFWMWIWSFAMTQSENIKKSLLKVHILHSIKTCPLKKIICLAFILFFMQNVYEFAKTAMKKNLNILWHLLNWHLDWGLFTMMHACSSSQEGRVHFLPFALTLLVWAL